MKFFITILIIVTSNFSYSKTLLILGDSLSSGYQMSEQDSWPVLLNDLLPKVDIINASVAGDTVANGLDRLPRMLELHNPDFILIELGGNDGLRGVGKKKIKAQLGKLIEISKDSGAKPLLMQIEVPPQFGRRYQKIFSSIYPELGKEYDIPIIPFLMTPIYLNKNLMKEDGIHPNVDAQPIIAKNMKAVLIDYL